MTRSATDWLTAASRHVAQRPPAPPMEHCDEALPRPSPEEGDAPVHYVLFDVVWMVQADETPSGRIQWVQLFPKDVEKRLEDMYLDEGEGNDAYVP